MMFKEYKNFFNLNECNALIDYFKRRACFQVKYENTIVVKLMKVTFPKLFNTLKKDFNITFNYGQIVYWPPFSYMDYHYDGTSEKNNTFTSICYLNDDFEGGQFLVRDIDANLKVGDMILFPSCFIFPHEVKEVTKGTRYSFISWAF